MKIVLNSVEDLQDLIGVLDAEFLRTWQPGLHAPIVTVSGDVTFADLGVSIADAMKANGPAVHAAEAAVAAMHETAGRAAEFVRDVTNAEGYETLDPACKTGEQAGGGEDLDSAGYRWDDRIHSTPPKRNANGTWRARRGVDKDLVAQVEAEQLKAENDAADDAEPVATETHALPQDESSINVTLDGEPLTAPEPETAPEVDHAALIEASQERAENAPDGAIDLLNAGKEFIKEYGTAKFEALKSAVCPTEDGKGKAIPSMVPAERRLMRACMDNYALYL